MYHSVLPEDSILPRFHHGQHTSHTVAWKCTESTEWAGSTGESRSLHLRANGHTDPPHSAMEQRRGSYTGEERGQVTRLLVELLVESYRVGTNFMKMLPAAVPCSKYNAASLHQNHESLNTGCRFWFHGRVQGKALVERTPLAWETR